MYKQLYIHTIEYESESINSGAQNSLDPSHKRYGEYRSQTQRPHIVLFHYVEL